MLAATLLRLVGLWQATQPIGAADVEPETGTASQSVAILVEASGAACTYRGEGKGRQAAMTLSLGCSLLCR